MGGGSIIRQPGSLVTSMIFKPVANLETRNSGYGVDPANYNIDLDDSAPYICLAEDIA